MIRSDRDRDYESQRIHTINIGDTTIFDAILITG